ncbi:MAG: hypothetical protein GXO25_05950 [Euryarchaeota archaeon]|nr:hypothetical protein [Euryarchaeota archaeon]
MNPDRERMMKAFIEVYEDFTNIYRDFYNFGEEPLEKELFIEISNLFHTAWNDGMLGEILREEMVRKYQEIMQAEQAKEEMDKEAGEAMII